MIPSVAETLAAFEAFGGTDIAYLSHHYQRFAATKAEFCSTWDYHRGQRLLDVGAHWLHQTYLWAVDGFETTAIDLPATFMIDSVQRFAEHYGIRLVSCEDLASADALECIPDDSVNVMLFTEIFEHLTFNPVAFWRQIHRILAPGARIIVTTPNYYAARGRCWDIGRFLSGQGGGITVHELLSTHTYGHHWREYSMREVIAYFCLLSPGFCTIKRRYPPPFDLSSKSGLARKVTTALEHTIPVLRPNLYLEIELVDKSHGIVIEPHW